MVYVPANNVLQVELRGTQNGEDIEVTQYFHSSTAITGTIADTIFDYYEATFIPALVPNMSIEAAWDELYATDLTSSSSPTYSRTLSPAVPGTITGDALPGNCACCISFRTAGRGRSARGRNFVPGMSENFTNGNNVDLGLINDLVAAYELLLPSGGFPIGLVWSIVSRFLDGAPRSSALVQSINDVLSTDVTIDSQRGRLH